MLPSLGEPTTAEAIAALHLFEPITHGDHMRVGLTLRRLGLVPCLRREGGSFVRRYVRPLPEPPRTSRKGAKARVKAPATVTSEKAPALADAESLGFSATKET